MPIGAITPSATNVAMSDEGSQVSGETIGQMIKRLREARGWNQVELAGLAEVTRSWLSRVELDSIRKPEREMLERVARVLGVPPETIWAAAGYRVKPLPFREPTVLDLARQMVARLEAEIEARARRAVNAADTPVDDEPGRADDPAWAEAVAQAERIVGRHPAFPDDLRGLYVDGVARFLWRDRAGRGAAKTRAPRSTPGPKADRAPSPAPGRGRR